MSTRHLWEIKHPYYGADGDYVERAESFAELREMVEASDEDLNHVYRWDWVPADPEYEQEEELRIFLALQRKSGFWAASCPIDRDQEAEVLEWLRGPRVLGSLARLWEPLLDSAEQE
jgi:hypothetical protein